MKVLSYFVADQDTHLEMNEFMQDHNIDTDSWKIVTSDMGPIYNTTINGSNPWTTQDPEYGFDTNAKVITFLLDREIHIRSLYHIHHFIVGILPTFFTLFY